MTTFTYINTNIDRIRKEIKAGIIPCTILLHWEIYSRYDIYRKMGHNTVMAVFFVAEQYKVSEILVYKIKRKMESEFDESTNNKLQPINIAS
jgi:hypothetical protein